MTVIPFPLARTFDKPGKWDFKAPAQILILPVIPIERELEKHFGLPPGSVLVTAGAGSD
jgi:hypothetical protein